MTSDANACLVSASDLCVRYGQASALAVNQVSLTIHRGESVALVGDSGCGKSTVALAMMGLLPHDATVGGAVTLHRNDGTHPSDVLQMAERDLRTVRGHRIAMVFQHPQASLNPVVRVGVQIAEVFRVGQQFNRKDARRAALDMLQKVGLSDPIRLYRSWADELSGGMAQRVMLAIALAGKPDLLIADEPTSGLDSNVQAQIVALIRDIRREANMAMLLITHDMGIARGLADRVCVMHGGSIVNDYTLTELPTPKFHEATVRLIESANRKRKGAVVTDGGAQ